MAITIDDLPVGYEWKPTLGELQAQQPGFGQPGAAMGLREGDPPSPAVWNAWNAAHSLQTACLRTILKTAHCATADDIDRLGCTGLMAYAEAIGPLMLNGHRIGELLKVGPGDHFMTAVIKFVRIGLAGSGAGLPCFVPPTRFCLGHNTIGGLQDGQEQRYTQYVDAISRELTPKERGVFELTEAARRSDKLTDAKDHLAGRTLPDGMEDVAEEEQLSGLPSLGRLREVEPEDLFKCAEHPTPNWNCRYCVAQMVVEGAFAPSFLVEAESIIANVVGLPGDNASHEPEQYRADGAGVVEALDNPAVNKLRVFVLAASFTRKLARD